MKLAPSKKSKTKQIKLSTKVDRSLGLYMYLLCRMYQVMKNSNLEPISKGPREVFSAYFLMVCAQFWQHNH